MPVRHLLVALLGLAACTDDPNPTSLLVVEEEVELGQVMCGWMQSSMVTIVNVGDRAANVAIAASLPNVTVTPPFSTIEPERDQVFEVAVTLPELGTPGFVSRGDLRVTTGVAGEAELRVPVSYETAGVSVTLNSPRTVDFGEIRPSSYSAGSVSLFATTVGVPVPGVAVTAGSPSSPAFAVTSVANHHVGIMLTGGPTARRHDATLALTVTGENLCSPRNLTVDLAGVVSTENVLADKLALDLGDIGPCSLASAGTSLSNFGPSSDVTATFDDPSGWLEWFGPNPTGSLEGAKVAVATAFGRERPAPGPFEARATIAHANGTKEIPIRGFVHSHTATPANREVDFGDVPADGTTTRRVTLRNSGTRVASISVTALNAIVTPQAMQIEPASTSDLYVTYTAKNPPGTDIAGTVEIRFGQSCSQLETLTLRGRIVK